MKFERFYLGTVALLAVCVMMTESTSSDNVSLDVSTKLTELTEQIARISEQLSKQSDGLDKLTNQVTELTDQQADAISRINALEGNPPAIDPKAKTDAPKTRAVSSGPVFVHWGKKTCVTTNAETIYTGVAAGQYSGATGGGADLLCLPRVPTYANFNNVDDSTGYITVAEYMIQGDSTSNFPFDNSGSLYRHDVPCAVCEVTNATTTIMIPARNICFDGWRLEYRGYLMADRYNSGTKRQHICVDQNPEEDNGGGGTASYSVELFVVETYCNYLPCPPFEAYAEVACVVCSK